VTTPVSGDITVYAKWRDATPVEYTVTFSVGVTVTSADCGKQRRHARERSANTGKIGTYI
jgi:hypothetical protein